MILEAKGDTNYSIYSGNANTNIDILGTAYTNKPKNSNIIIRAGTLVVE